jgi:pimeloyl-ACP methyl ester carboxylesterase
MACDAAWWTRQKSALSERFSVTVFPDFYRHDSLTTMATDVLDSAPSRFALAGHSMGPRVALEIKRVAPERVERFALFDTTARPARPESSDTRQKLVALGHDKGMAALVARWLPTILHRDRLQDAELVNTLTAMFCRANPEIYARHVNAVLTRPDYRPVLPEISCPTLVACGRDDLLCPAADHLRMTAKIRSATLAIIDGCAHMATAEAQDIVTSLLRSWLLE